MNIDNCWYKKACNNKCSQSCIRYNLMYSLFKNSWLPEYQWNYKTLICGDIDMKSFIKLSEIDMNDFVVCGHNLYIYSNICGNGKTSWAVRLMYKYFDKIWHLSSFDSKAVFVNVQKFLYNCKRSISQKVDGFEELCNTIAKADLVVWDDISCSQVTDYEHQILFQYIDDRISAGKSNIFTGNADERNCKRLIGERLTSRIFSDMLVEFKEPDKRRFDRG